LLTRRVVASKAMKGSTRLPFIDDAGAGNEARTRDLNLGKVALYQLSYSRVMSNYIALLDTCIGLRFSALPHARPSSSP
jgi:hypothetical protein